MLTSDIFNSWIHKAQQQTELILERALPQSHLPPEELHQAMRYVTLNGGKRLRPMLVFAAAHLGHADETLLDACVAAVECIHVYSLVHDDMPEMDNDTLRRGKPTCHVKYNQATALLVGDALQTLAFDLLSRESDFPAQRQLKMMQTLAHASGHFGMAGGQAIDLSHVGQNMNQDELENMHHLKTGALIQAAVSLGALSCPEIIESQLLTLDCYANYLGLAFQVMDDVLDCEQDTVILGKTAGKDEDNNKPTYVKLLGLEKAKTYAENLINESILALNSFDKKADYLRALASYVIQRNH